MDLTKLLKIVEKSKKRIGRGHGSGKVKTAGRGTKGQKARGNIRSDFEGGQLPLIKRLPLLRGKTRNKSRKEPAYPLSVGKLSALPAGTIVTLDILRKHHMIDDSIERVKILGGGKLSAALTVSLPCSKKAASIIEKAGGKITDGQTSQSMGEK